jgi:prolyl 4-hydroxylase
MNQALDGNCLVDVDPGTNTVFDQKEQNCASTRTTDTKTVSSDARNSVAVKEEAHGEASYVYPINHTVPAPRTFDGLGTDLGEPQHVDANHATEIHRKIEEAREYIYGVVKNDNILKTVEGLCKNKHPSCAFWSVIGECENNPGYMQTNCGPVCSSCHMLHVDTRCPIDENAVDAFAKPGDLNTMFERIISDPYYEQYEPKVVSRPPEGPWMLMFESAITDEEAERLIELGHEEGYERSADVGAKQDDGTYTKNVNSGRTSTNAWCIGKCYEDPVAKRVAERISNITGIPETNSENLQLLRYTSGQYYQTHSDYIDYQRERQCGVRILTFYMYLNDVEHGGGTAFPALNLTVTPKRGRAVLWPSVLDEDPNAKDPRTVHTAQHVKEDSVKFGANAWIHQRDFKNPNKNHCA